MKQTTDFEGSKLTKAQMKALADSHLRLYNNMAEHGGRGIRVGECMALIRIWEGVAASGYEWANLTEPQRNEVEDACFCGDYDKLLTAVGEAS